MIRREFLKLVAASPLAAIAGNAVAPVKTEAIANNKPKSLDSIVRFHNAQFCAEDNRIYWLNWGEREWNVLILPVCDSFEFWQKGHDAFYWFGRHTIYGIDWIGGELQIRCSWLGSRRLWERHILVMTELF